MDLALLTAASPWTPMAAGLAFGALHACDADHVMTVTSVSRSSDTSRSAIWSYGLRWASGHAFALIGIGTLLAACGWTFPWALGAAAETLVACVLILLGAYLLHKAVLGRTAPTQRRSHAPALRLGTQGVFGLGILHGLAGAAPVIALIPLSGRLNPWFSCAYLLCFSLGVILAMMVIATLLSSANDRVRRHGMTLERVVNTAVGIGACTVGLHIVGEVLS